MKTQFVAVVLVVSSVVSTGAVELFVPIRAEVTTGDVIILARSEEGRLLELTASTAGVTPVNPPNWVPLEGGAASFPTRLTDTGFPSSIEASIDGEPFFSRDGLIRAFLQIEHEAILAPTEFTLDRVFNSAPGEMEVLVDWRNAMNPQIRADILLQGTLEGTMTYGMEYEFTDPRDGIPRFRIRSFEFRAVPEPQFSLAVWTIVAMAAFRRRRKRI